MTLHDIFQNTEAGQEGLRRWGALIRQGHGLVTVDHVQHCMGGTEDDRLLSRDAITLRSDGRSMSFFDICSDTMVLPSPPYGVR